MTDILECYYTIILRLLTRKILSFPEPRISESCIEMKIILNFYFHISLSWLKMFYEGF